MIGLRYLGTNSLIIDLRRGYLAVSNLQKLLCEVLHSFLGREKITISFRRVLLKQIATTTY
jgi:hypothetical protein